MSAQKSRRRFPVAIIGGGFSGAAVALHLARRGLRSILYEPRGELGRGLAYGNDESAFRTNVPASRMSIFPDELSHFQKWIEKTDVVAKDSEALAADGGIYPSRRVFGDYVAAQVEPYLKAGLITHAAEKALSVERDRYVWRVAGESGVTVEADVVVVAATHPAASIPAPLRPIAADEKFCRDLGAENPFPALQKDEAILIVGAGLTALDALVLLEKLGHSGPTTLISRRGQRPQPQASHSLPPFGDFTTRPERTALRLLRRVRRALAFEKPPEMDWQIVLDAVRAQGPKIWAALPLDERRRLVRHLRPYWDANRFRMSPQAAAVLAQREQSGKTELIKARVVSARRDGSCFAIELAKAGQNVLRRYDRIVLATGPSHKDIFREPPFASLASAGLIAIDPAELGLSVTPESEAIAASGRIVHDLFVAGPLARGTFGELMGLPEVARHAQFVANEIATRWGNASRADAVTLAG